jgi:hypothetical protein
VIFKTVYPIAILVTAVVTFVLYPVGQKLKQQDMIDRFFQKPAIIMHNHNSLFLLIELVLCNPFDVQVLELGSFSVLFGIFYGLFSMFWFLRTKIFYYFFLDWRQPYAWLGKDEETLFFIPFVFLIFLSLFLQLIWFCCCLSALSWWWNT